MPRKSRQREKSNLYLGGFYRKSILLRKRKKILYADNAKTAGGGKISFGLRHGLSNFTRIRVWKSRLSKSEACGKSNSRVSIRARCHMVSESNAVPLTHSLCARPNALTRRVYKKTRRDGKIKTTRYSSFCGGDKKRRYIGLNAPLVSFSALSIKCL